MQKSSLTVDADIIRAQLANAVLHACSVLMSEANDLLAYPMLGRLAETEVVFELRSNSGASRLYIATLEHNAGSRLRIQRFDDAGKLLESDAFDAKVSAALERGLEATVRAYFETVSALPSSSKASAAVH